MEWNTSVKIRKCPKLFWHPHVFQISKTLPEANKHLSLLKNSKAYALTQCKKSCLRHSELHVHMTHISSYKHLYGLLPLQEIIKH